MAFNREMKCIALKWLTLALVTSALCGCLGGSIAQQIARSILMNGADKVTAAAIDEHERKEKLAAQQLPLKDTVPSDYQIAFLNSGFEKITPQIEPLPERLLDDDKPIQRMQESKLVQVEVWSLLIGDEKQNILEKARIQGSISIPPKSDWQQWHIAIGATESTKSKSEQTITFLIPPEIGKMHSGAKALVELSSAGDLSVARYALN
jgi:hypothetical protein